MADPAPSPSAPRARLAGAGVFLGVFALYLATNYPYVATGDNAEFQTLSRVGGIAHSGYPTFVLALHAFGALPWSTVAYRANLLVVLCGAIAAGLAAYEGARLSGRAWAGVVGGIALALGFTLWQSSTLAEIYAFTLVPAIGLYMLARRLAARPTALAAGVAGALGGLGLGSHLTILALAPVVLLGLAFAARAGRLRGAHVASLLVGFVLGLAPFLYFVAQDRPDAPMNYLAARLLPGPERDPARAKPVLARAGDAIYLLTGRQYLGTHGEIHTLKDSFLRFRYAFFDVVLNEWFVIGVPLAIYGAWLLARRGGVERWLLGTWVFMAAFLVWFAAIGVDLLPQFFIGGLWIIAVLAGVALAGLSRRRPWLGGLAAALLLAAPLVRFVVPEPPGLPPSAHWTWAQVPADWSPTRPDRTWDEFGRGVMATLPPRAVVCADWAEAMTLKYFHVAEGVRPDVDVVLTETPQALSVNALAILAAGRPCATTLVTAGDAPRGALTGIALAPAGAWKAGRLWSVAPAPMSASGAPPAAR